MTTSSSAPTTPVARRNQRAKQAATGSKPLAVLYFVLAIVGLGTTWYFNLIYTGGNYVGDWFANAASSSAASDILVVFVVTIAFYLKEGRRLGWRLPVILILIPLSLILAVAFIFPLFLGVRELQLARRPAVRPEADQDSTLD